MLKRRSPAVLQQLRAFPCPLGVVFCTGETPDHFLGCCARSSARPCFNEQRPWCSQCCPTGAGEQQHGGALLAVMLTALFAPQMSWRPQYRSSKFRNVYGKVASREHCFDGIPITKNVHDNHFCAVNARFLAIVTESAGGGSFLVIPLEQVSALLLPGASQVSSCSVCPALISLVGLLLQQSQDLWLPWVIGFVL